MLDRIDGVFSEYIFIYLLMIDIFIIWSYGMHDKVSIDYQFYCRHYNFRKNNIVIVSLSVWGQIFLCEILTSVPTLKMF